MFKHKQTNILFALTMIMVTIGLIMVYSASAPIAKAKKSTTSAATSALVKAQQTPRPLATTIPQINARVSGQDGQGSTLDTLRHTIEAGGLEDPLSEESFQAIVRSSLHSQSGLTNQIIAFIAGLIAMFFVFKVNIDRYSFKWLNLGMLITFLLLLSTYFFQARNNAHRWIDLVHLTMQPSELAKLVLVLWTSRILTIPQFHEDVSSRFSKIGRMLKSSTCIIMLVLGAMCLVVFFEPDMGATIALIAIVCAIALAYGLPKKWIIIISVFVVGLGTLGLHVESYRIERMTAFLDMDNPTVQLNAGYQLRQSLIALGSGGIWGVGLGAGQQKYQYLSEVENDFIYALIGEEFGLVGTTIVLLLYASFVTIGLLIAKNATTMFARLVAVGITTMIGISSMIHIVVVIGLAPTKGLTLPLISYGGTSLVINLVAVGILLGIAKDNEQKGPRLRRRNLDVYYQENDSPASLSRY